MYSVAIERLVVAAVIDSVNTAISIAGSASAETIISREAPMPPKAVPMSRPANAVKKRASAKKPTSTMTSAIAAVGRRTATSGTTAAASSMAPNTM